MQNGVTVIFDAAGEDAIRSVRPLCDCMTPVVQGSRLAGLLKLHSTFPTRSGGLQRYELTHVAGEAVDVTLRVAPELVEAYNEEHETSFELFPENLVSIEENGAVLIGPEDVFSDYMALDLTAGEGVVEGQTYLLPVAFDVIQIFSLDFLPGPLCWAHGSSLNAYPRGWASILARGWRSATRNRTRSACIRSKTRRLCSHSAITSSRSSACSSTPRSISSSRSTRAACSRTGCRRTARCRRIRSNSDS